MERKNTRPFGAYQGGLTELKLQQLRLVDGFTHIYLTTDDEDTIHIGQKCRDPRIVIDRRPASLCAANARVDDLIAYIGRLCAEDHVFWVHATSPFVDTEHYERALKQYQEALQNGFDSMMSVTRLQQFIWDPVARRVINNNTGVRWPQTQDLPPLFEINHAFYISSRQNYHALGDRIGVNPFLFELRGVETIDVDWPDQFEIAERVLCRG